MNEMKNAIHSLGMEVSVESRDGLKRGRAVITPIRPGQKLWGGVEQSTEGRTEPKRYSMLCARELLDRSDYGDRVYSGRDSFVIIWKDDYSSTAGCYTKACLRRIDREEGDDCE